MSEIETSGFGFGRPAPREEFAPEEPEPLPRTDREGLPASYRMRADTHYVDTLTGRHDRFDRPSQPAVPAARNDASDPPAPASRGRRSDRVLAQVGEEIAAITSAAALLGVDASPLARQTGQDLIRAQAWRASWLLKAAVLLDGRHTRQTRPVALTSLVEQLRQGLTPECRLAGVALQVHAPDVTVVTDAALVSTGVTGAVIATLSLIAGCEGAAVRVTFDVAAGQLRGVDVTQELVAPSADTVGRFFDPAWSDRPGGWTALMGALAAREAARLHGDQTTLTGEPGGSRLRVGLAGR